jgi:hypothetical protein
MATAPPSWASASAGDIAAVAVSMSEILSFEMEGVAAWNRSGEPFYIDNTSYQRRCRMTDPDPKRSYTGGFDARVPFTHSGHPASRHLTAQFDAEPSGQPHWSPGGLDRGRSWV